MSAVKHDRSGLLPMVCRGAKVTWGAMSYRLITLVLAVIAPIAATAQPCPPHALGTSRTLEVDAATFPRIGRKQFPQTLPLQHKELVLTFDDGPIPATTPKALDALKAECVRATFFLLGRNSITHRQLARRILAEGHTVGHHTYSHPNLSKRPFAKALEEINHGFEVDDDAIYGQRRTEPRTPFFRFPGFASTPPLLDALARRRVVVFGADVWASDWNDMTPAAELKLILQRIQAIDHGIVLLHDTRAQTVRMLPEFLRELKKRGYRIVHVVPAGGR